VTDDDLKPAFAGMTPASLEAKLEEEKRLNDMEAEYLHELAEVKIKSAPGRDMTGQLATALANRTLLKLLAGDYPVTNINQALKVVEVAAKIAQTAEGDGIDPEAQFSRTERKEIAAQLRKLTGRDAKPTAE